MIKKLLPLPIVVLLVVSLFRDNKPVETLRPPSRDDQAPTVYQTSLLDTMPAASLQALGLTHVEGLKVHYHNGDYASYFEYVADADAVLREIGHLPFPRYTEQADTLCRKMDIATLDAELKKLSEVEAETFSSFWNIDRSEYEVYECLKGSFRHTVLISQHSRSILHRIEFREA